MIGDKCPNCDGTIITSKYDKGQYCTKGCIIHPNKESQKEIGEMY